MNGASYEARSSEASSFPTKILLATDGSEHATLAACVAADIHAKTGAELHVATIVQRSAGGPPLPHVGFPSPEVATLPPAQQEVNKEAQRLLDTQVEWIETAGGTVAQVHLRSGRPDVQIIALAEEIGAGMVVVGNRGLSSVRRALLGSVSDSVVRQASCPVLVVRGGEDVQAEPVFFSGRILWATDGSEEAELAGRNALEIAEKTGSELHALHVGPAARYAAAVGSRAALSSAQEALDKAAWRLLYTQVKKIEAAGGSVAQAHVRSSERPDLEIVALAEELGAGLIAMGSRGLGGTRRALLGSVSSSVIRHAYGSVLVVRDALIHSQNGNTAS